MRTIIIIGHDFVDNNDNYNYNNNDNSNSNPPSFYFSN